MKFRVFSIILAMLLIGIAQIGASCGSSVKPPCISENNEKLILRWGVHYVKDNKVDGYEIDSKPDLYKVSFIVGDTSKYVEKLSGADAMKYCEYVVFMMRKIVKNFPVYQPADTMNFVEFIEPVTNVFYRAAWNPKYVTTANKDYRMLFDSLQALVPAKKSME